MTSPQPRCSALLALLATLAGGCIGHDDAVPFQLHLVFGSDLGGSRHCQQACDAYGFACGGRLGIRIADAHDLQTAHYFNCVSVPPADDLCGLNELEMTLGRLPAGPARIELALWNPNHLGDQFCVNEPFFDLQGEPMAITPAPAIAGAAYFDIGSAPDAYVPMACVFPAQLNLPACGE